MSYCLKFACFHPQNPENVSYCLSCGSKLLLQRYRVLKPIGQGGFGRTFLAVDESNLSKPRCVIKQFFSLNQSANNQQKAAELFHQEALRLNALGKHAQVPELIDYFEQDGYQYLVQEFIDGQNLAQELTEEGAFNELQIRSLLSDLLPVLQFVHDHQVIHRDIKPANIIRRRSDEQLVLVDFGAAKYATGTALAQTGTVIGSAEYTAPEQTRGKAVFASDLYSLGVTCIHLLTQIPPFDIFDSSEDAWVWRCYLGYPVSESLGLVIDKLLQNATKRRYQSAQAVLRELNSQQTQVLTESLLNIETVIKPDIEWLSEKGGAKSTDLSLPVIPVFSVTVFDPKTQSWHRIPNLFERSESVRAVAPFICPSTVVTQKRRESSWLVLTALWVAIFTFLAVGLRLKQPSTSSALEHVCSFLEDVQPR